MTLSNLYFRGCFEQPSEDQKNAIEEAGGIAEVVDRSCSRTDLNTCGTSIERLFELYSIYNPQKGLYRSWGDIDFPWQISNLTPNLLFSSSSDRWSLSEYRSIAAYKKDSMVLLIEDDGFRVGLYRAKEDILSISGAFDFSKWERICYVETTIPVGLPSIDELLSRYSFYNPELYDVKWGRYQKSWSEALKTQTLQSCTNQGLTLEEFQNCIDFKSTDEWNKAKIRRDFVYRAGDIVLVEGGCKDVICVYIATIDIPTTDYIWEKYSLSEGKFFASMYLSEEDEEAGNITDIWQRIYCVPTGDNKCLEYQRKKEPELGYDVTEIGSKGHFVEVPIPYRLKPPVPSLDERAQRRTPPVVLTQEQIDSLNQIP